MAKSGSMIYAQASLGDIECDLCGTYKAVKWKCDNCNEILCEQCKNIHKKSKASRQHDILELKDASHESPESGVFCQRHPKEVLSEYCKTCGYLICVDCSRGNYHRYHQFDSITDVIEEKQKEFNSIITYAKQTKVPTLTRALHTVMENQTNYNEGTDHVISDITSKAEELKQEIDKIRDKLIRDIEKRRTEDQKYLNETKLDMEEKLNEMTKLFRKGEETIKDLNDLRNFQNFDAIKQAISSLESISETSQIIPPVFVSSPFKQQQLERMYGNIIHTSEESQEKTVDTKVSIISLFTYKTNIWSMQTVNTNEVFITSIGKEIGLANRNGKVLKILENKNAIYGIAVTQSGDILATSWLGTLINRITQSGYVSIFADMSPYRTLGIHVSKDGDILVGLNNIPIMSALAGLFVHRKDKTGRLARLSPTGQTKQVIEYDDKESLLYDSPGYITQNINGDIWVSDIGNDDPCVTVVDVGGGYRFTYRGPSHIKMNQKFSPHDMLHNQYGQILVIDNNNDTIHLVDKDGDFLQYVLTQDDGIPEPRALSVDDDGQLWIGCLKGQVVVVNYMPQTKRLK